MTQYQYTHAAQCDVDFESSALDYLWYNQNDKTLIVEWIDSDANFLYANVSLDEYLFVINAESPGKAMAALKRAKGPGSPLGVLWDDNFEEAKVVESVNINPAKDVLSVTKEYSLVTPPAPKSTAPAGIEVPDSWNWTITYDLEGRERTFEFNNGNLSVALDSLAETVAKLGLDITVKRAEVVFV